MGSAYWGTGLFVGGAAQVLDFAFETVGVIRLEARAVVVNGRGNGALRKIGAVQEGVLRRSFVRRGQHYDQVMWSMLAEDWHRRQEPPPHPHPLARVSSVHTSGSGIPGMPGPFLDTSNTKGRHEGHEGQDSLVEVTKGGQALRVSERVL